MSINELLNGASNRKNWCDLKVNSIEAQIITGVTATITNINVNNVTIENITANTGTFNYLDSNTILGNTGSFTNLIATGATITNGNVNNLISQGATITNLTVTGSAIITGLTLGNINVQGITCSNYLYVGSDLLNVDNSSEKIGIKTQTNSMSSDTTLEITGRAKINGYLNVDNIEAYNTILTLGGSSGTSSINIGGSDDLNTINIGSFGIGATSTTINIGTIGDIVNIGGTLNYVSVTDLNVENKNINLNVGSTGSGTARGAGVNIQDNGITASGYMIVGSTGTNYLFKAPENNYVLETPILTQNDEFLTNYQTQTIEGDKTFTGGFLVDNDLGLQVGGTVNNGSNYPLFYASSEASGNSQLTLSSTEDSNMKIRYGFFTGWNGPYFDAVDNSLNTKPFYIQELYAGQANKSAGLYLGYEGSNLSLALLSVNGKVSINQLSADDTDYMLDVNGDTRLLGNLEVNGITATYIYSDDSDLIVIRGDTLTYTNANITNLNTIGASMSYINAGGANITGISGSTLTYVNANITNLNIVGASMSYINAGGANITGISGSTLTYVNANITDLVVGSTLNVSRATLGDKKILLWDNNSGSTTAFYGFGVQSNELRYNVNSSFAKHNFYDTDTNLLASIGSGLTQIMGGISATTINSGQITVNTSANQPISINSTSSTSGPYIPFQKSSTNKMAFGYDILSLNGGIGIFDNVNANFWLQQNGITSGYIRTVNNILDNGSGLMTLSSGLVLPTSGGTPSTLNYYEGNTYSTTTAGAIVTSLTIKFVKIGKLIQLTIPAFNGTATDADGINIPSMPSRIYPRANTQIPVFVRNNGATVAGSAYIDTTGYINLNVGTGSPFTDGTNIGASFDISLCYETVN